MNEAISRTMQIMGCSEEQAIVILEEIERQREYAKGEERKNILEFLRLKVLCRIRGLKIDIQNGYEVNNSLGEYEELLRHLEQLKWIDADISCAKKYLSDVERHEFMVLRERLGFEEDNDAISE